MNDRPRPHMPLKVKLDAALIALGLEPGNVDFDHDPALRLRAFDPETQTYTPDANDPRFIVPRAREDHRDKTKGDAKQIAAKRQSEKALELKVDTQAARLERARQILAKAASGEPVERKMREPEKRKPKMQGPKLRRKNDGGQKRATRPIDKWRAF